MMSGELWMLIEIKNYLKTISRLMKIVVILLLIILILQVVRIS
jgi:hypothetical protein